MNSVIGKRGYSLEQINLHDTSAEYAAEFMKGCIIKEVRKNRRKTFIETKPNEIKLVPIFHELPENETEHIHKVIDGIEITLDSPSILLERLSDGKQFIIQISTEFSWWFVFEVVYKNNGKIGVNLYDE